MTNPSFRIRLILLVVGSCLSGAGAGAWAVAEAQQQQDGLWLLFTCAGLAAIVAGFGAYGMSCWLVADLDRIERSISRANQGEFESRTGQRGLLELRGVRRALDTFFEKVEDLASRTRKSGGRLGSMLSAIASASRQQESASGELSEATQRIEASARQICDTADGLMRTVSDVDKLANLAAESADRGKSGVQRMERSIHQIAEASTAIASKLAVLNERAANISSVVTTINKVAEQTNLLSFNAAIEAEKAGEFGLGFAVVATEIRRLADQTAIATRDIEKMIREIQSAVSAGVMGMDKFGEEVRRGVEEIGQVNGQISQIINQVKSLVPRFSTVTGGVQTQLSGAQEITETLVLLNTHARQTSRAMDHTGQAVVLLSDAAADIKTGMERFRSAA